MYKITETYTDYDGNERTEDFYFHVTKAEIMEMDFLEEGGLQKTVERITSTQDRKGLLDLFKSVVIMAYGEKSPDGRRFIKSKEVKDNFTETEAYSNIFMRLATDSKLAAEFINNIVPKDLQEEAAKQSMNNKIASAE